MRKIIDYFFEKIREMDIRIIFEKKDVEKKDQEEEKKAETPS